MRVIDPRLVDPVLAAKLGFGQHTAALVRAAQNPAMFKHLVANRYEEGVLDSTQEGGTDGDGGAA